VLPTAIKLPEATIESAATPITGIPTMVQESPVVPPASISIRVIDWLRPDHALLRGMAMAHTPQPYEERYAHQGKRECMRRMLQRTRGII
jgi:hypothetical protein